MDRLKKLLLSSILLFQINILFGQSNEISNAITINESISIDCNDTSFVTGETLLYKLYCINQDQNTLSTISKIGYIALIDSERKTVFTQKLFLEKGTGYGDFFISTKLESGNYKLIGYTNWMLNAKKPYLYNIIDLKIINPYKATNNTSIIEEEISVLQNEIKNSNEPSNIELNKKVYTTRDLVKLKLKSNFNYNSKGSYSISIKKIDSLYTLQKPRNNKTNTTELKKNEILFYPEFRGEIITGNISSKTNSSIENKIISLSISGKINTFKTTKTNAQGKFVFNLETPNSNSNITIQVVDSEKENYYIQISEPIKQIADLLVFNNKFRISKNLKKSIEERSIANQIQNSYYEQKKDSIHEPMTLSPFYNTNEKVYHLDDYTRFPTLKETIIEIIPGLRFEKKNDNYSLHVKDNDINNEFKNPSLVLVDGLLIQDIGELFIEKSENFDNISLVNGSYYYGSKLFNGIISFTTKNYEYETKLKGDFIIKPSILRPQSIKTYNNPNYFEKSKLETIPDYRYQLYWDPKFDIGKTITFYTSDVTGFFEMAINGLTEDGKQVSIRETFEVKE